MTDDSATSADATVDYDSDVWIEVPLEFPAGGIATVEEWAELLAADATRSSATAADLLLPIREAALTVASFPRGLASRRYWYFPLTAHTTAVVQHFELPRDAAFDEVLVEFLGSHDDRSTDPVVTESVTTRGERVVTAAFMARESPASNHSAVFGVVRIARVSDDSIDLFELVDEDLFTAGTVTADLQILAASVGRGPFDPSVVVPAESTS